nr:uncharacterized protein LOC127302065 isoform X1 [Lolium perenne]
MHVCPHLIVLASRGFSCSNLKHWCNLKHSDALKQDDIWSTSIFQITQAIAFILQLRLKVNSVGRRKWPGTNSIKPSGQAPNCFWMATPDWFLSVSTAPFRVCVGQPWTKDGLVGIRKTEIMFTSFMTSPPGINQRENLKTL